MSNYSLRELAVLDIAREKVSDEVDGYIKAALNLMIDRGYVSPFTRKLYKEANGEQVYGTDFSEVSYYGSRASTDAVLTRRALYDIAEHGIVYSKSTDPAECEGSVFAGTFCDYDEKFTYLRSIIFTPSTYYVFTYDYYEGFGKLITELGEYKDFTAQEIAETRKDCIKSRYGGLIDWAHVEKEIEFRMKYGYDREDIVIEA